MNSGGKVRSALVVVDMQRGLLEGEARPHHGAEILFRTKALVAQARRSNVTTVFVQHHGPKGSPIEQGSQAWELAGGLSVVEGDWVVQKMRPSIFLGTDLRDRFSEAGIGQLFLAGMKTDYCIDTSCRVGAELGFQMMLIGDAHTTTDSPVLPASTIIAHHNLTLGSAFARLLASDQIDFQAA